MASGFESFYAAEYENVVRALTFAAGSRSCAEDWAQDAFATALRKWRTVQLAENPVGWVYVVAVRAGRKKLRRDERNLATSDRSSMEHLAVLADARLDVASALAGLTVRQRTTVVLTYFAGLSVREVASSLGVADGTVKATLHQARDRLRPLLEDPTEVSQ